MTVSTINSGVSAELRRAQDNLNKQVKPLALQPSGASLPDDLVPEPVPASASGPSLAEAVRETETQNAAAAASTLTDADIDQLIAERPAASEQVSQDPSASIAAQTRNLSPKMLELLAE
jgi:hypothetical protein